MANCNTRKVWAWLTVLFAAWMGLAAPGPSWSQPPIPDTPAVELPAPAPLPETAQVAVRGPCDPDYWIVSTRCCDDSAESCLPAAYQTYRFDGPNPGRASTLDELLASLQPGVPVCFMAHGSFVIWDSVLNDSAQTYRWLRAAAPAQPIHIIFFTWPSDDTSRLIPHCDVNKLGHRATLHGLYLADLVSRIPAENPVCLIGHSHGARMVSGTLQALAGGVVEGRVLAGGPNHVHRIRAVLAAPAMDHDWFNPGQRFDRALCRAEAAVSVSSRLDLPLRIYPVRRPFSSRALAITGLTRSDRRKLGETACRLDDCDVTDLVQCGHIWKHYYRHPEIACAIRHYVYFDE